MTVDTQVATTAPPKTPTARQRIGWPKFKRVIHQILLWIPLILLMLWTLVPFFITVMISLKTRGEVFGSTSVLPNDPSLDAYREVIERPGFRGAFVNSVLVGIGTTFLTLLLATPAAEVYDVDATG